MAEENEMGPLETMFQKQLNRLKFRMGIRVSRVALYFMREGTLHLLRTKGPTDLKALELLEQTLKLSDQMYLFVGGRDELENQLWEEFPALREMIDDRRTAREVRDLDIALAASGWKNPDDDVPTDVREWLKQPIHERDPFGPGTLRPPER